MPERGEMRISRLELERPKSVQMQIRSGDEVVFETLDATAGRAMTECDEYVVPPPPPPERMDPLTGPVGVQGAQNGQPCLWK
jgi:acetamidase/formamidase